MEPQSKVAGLTIYAHPAEDDEKPEVMFEWSFELAMAGVKDKAQLPLLATRELARKIRQGVKKAAAGKPSRESVFLDHDWEISVYVSKGSIGLSFGPGDCAGAYGPGVQFEEFAHLDGAEASEVARALDAAAAAFK